MAAFKPELGLHHQRAGAKLRQVTHFLLDDAAGDAWAWIHLAHRGCFIQLETNLRSNLLRLTLLAIIHHILKVFDSSPMRNFVLVLLQAAIFIALFLDSVEALLLIELTKLIGGVLGGAYIDIHFLMLHVMRHRHLLKSILRALVLHVRRQWRCSSAGVLGCFWIMSLLVDARVLLA